MGAAGSELLRQRQRPRFELQHRQRRRRRAQCRRHQRDRQNRHHRTDTLHQKIRKPLGFGKARILIERAEVDAALLHILAQRQRRAEADAGIAEAIPAPSEP